MSTGRSRGTRAGTLTTADLVVLSLLSERPMHGYALVEEYNRQQVADWAQVSRAHIYYALKKLAALKLIEPVELGQGRGRERIAYRPSRAGKSKLEATLGDDEWARQMQAAPFISWLGLSIHAAPADARRIIEVRKVFLADKLAHERNTLDEMKGAEGARDSIGKVMVGLAIEQIEAELRALDQAGKNMRGTGAID